MERSRAWPQTKKKAAGGSGGFFQYSYVWSYALFKLLGDVIELGIERAADRIDGSNDHNRNAGGDQAVFDGGSTRLIIQKRTLRICHNSCGRYGNTVPPPS